MGGKGSNQYQSKPGGKQKQAGGGKRDQESINSNRRLYSRLRTMDVPHVKEQRKQIAAAMKKVHAQGLASGSAFRTHNMRVTRDHMKAGFQRDMMRKANANVPSKYRIPDWKLQSFGR